jgi:HK97 family phage portal protein
VQLISNSISTLPTDVFREVGDEKLAAPIPNWLINPTVDLEFGAWCGQVLTSLLLHGNAYVVVQRNSAAQIVALVPLDPLKVSITRENGRKVFLINGFPANDEIVHIKGMMLPGSDEGLSPIEFARRTIGLGIAAVDFGSNFFDGEGNMPGVIELPHPAQPETMRNLANQWRRKRNRRNRGLPGVLQNGAAWKPTGVNHEQAQFLATRKYSAAEIAGQMFLIDPTDLGIPIEGTALTYANLEQRNARRVQVTLLPWIVRIETAITALLMGPRYMKFNVNGLLRGDQSTRFTAYQTGIASGFMEPNEARAFEDWPPLPERPAPDPPAPLE